MTEFGAEIATHGVRPPFVRDGDEVEWTVEGLRWHQRRIVNWDAITAIRLPADHPQYLVMKHPGMVMHTGDTRPEDFDAGKPVLCGDGSLSGPRAMDYPYVWAGETAYPIIGYHRLPASPSVEQGVSFRCHECCDTGFQRKNGAHCPCQPPLTEQDDVSLLPCPFCGATASLLECTSDRTGEPDGMWFIRCDPCDMVRSQCWDKPKVEVIAAWNARTTQHETPPVDEAEALWAAASEAAWQLGDERAIDILRDYLARRRGRDHDWVAE